MRFEQNKLVKLPVFGVVEPIVPGETQVLPNSCDTLRFGTTVVEVTERGAVPVAIVEMRRVPVMVELAVIVVNEPAAGVPVPMGPEKLVVTVNVVNVAAFGVVEPIAGGTAQVLPNN